MYTDSESTGHIGAVLVSVESRQVWHIEDDVPCGLKRKLRRRATQINPYEAAAVLCALATFAPMLNGERVVVFIDNGAALGAVVKGWARPPDINMIIEGCWAILATHGIDAQFEWVPSKSNLADAPSRRDVALLSAMNSERMVGV